jgi:hypothetical protein
MDLPIKNSLDEVLLQVQTDMPRKVLFWGEGAGGISSYVAGWMAGQGVDVIILDGANRFDPYMASSFARKALIPPEKLLKRIRIARAFTCYQMATLIEERLVSLLKQKGEIIQQQKTWVILLGLITPFLDEDVPEREARPLFERSRRKIEEMAAREIPFFLFQPSNPPSTNKGGYRRPEPDDGAGRAGGLMNSKRAYLTRRLFQLSDLIWRIYQDDEGPKVVLEKGAMELQILDRRINNKLEAQS